MYYNLNLVKHKVFIMYIFLSPHFDDAVGSAGGTIYSLAKNRKSIKIITVMGGVPANKTDADYVLSRQAENEQACSILAVPHQHAPFLDAIYRTNNLGVEIYQERDSIFKQDKILEKELVQDVIKYIKTNSSPDDILITPSALGNHIDHLIVKNAAQQSGRIVVYYEDFFYDTIAKNINYRDLFPVYLTKEQLAIKLQAIMAYKSQIRPLFKSSDGLLCYFKEFHTDKGVPVERFSSDLRSL